jgi:hypothetical protein
MYTCNVNMKLKAAAFVLLAFLAVPFASFAQSPSSLTVTDIADNSIVVLSQEDTGVPGYVHQKYAFNCFGQLKLVDYYGSAFDPKDQDVLQFERVMCSRQQNNDYEGAND